MSKGLLAYLKDKIQETVEKVPSIVNVKVTYVGQDTIQGVVIYGNKNVITHYMEGEILKNIRINNSTGTVPVDIAIGDIVQVSFINGDSNAPYLIGKVTKGTTGTGAVPSSQEQVNVPQSVASADATYLNTSLKDISDNYDSFTSIINALHSNINTINASQTWDPNYKIIIAPNKGGQDNFGQVEGLPLPESYINLIIALKLKELLIRGGAHKNSIMLTREWETKPNNVTVIEEGIKSFYPTFCISIQSWSSTFTNIDLVYGDDSTRAIQKIITENLKKTYTNKEIKNDNNGLTDFSNEYSIRTRFPPDMFLFNYSTTLFDNAVGTATLNNLYSIAFDITNAILKANGLKEISPLNATYSGDLATLIKRIIYANEAGAHNYTENQTPGYYVLNRQALMTIGAAQWQGGRVKNLLRLIKQKDINVYNTLRAAAPSLADYIDNEDWSKRSFKSDSERTACSEYINSNAGREAQEATIYKDIDTYIASAKKLGITDNKAIAYYADAEHHLGSGGGPSWFKDNIKSKGLTPTLDNLHAAAKSSTTLSSVYQGRQIPTYNYLKGLTI